MNIRRAGSTAAIVSALFQFGLVQSAFAYPDCDRYKTALQDPAVVGRLEQFYSDLPKKFDKKKLRVASARLMGIGAYSIQLGFDPRLIGLNASAEARIGIDDKGRLTLLAITDVRGSMFYFRTNEKVESFERLTLSHPRGNRVGVLCLQPD